ncbi:ABC transporter ATP-binding protein [Daejeonella lutea]|uniref:ABC-type bacteriocin/lantibiotic exporter, contains an N-terminal double-glycine peptidase domain n=1 Tax=Daejeonella lutea TaxID=572036 RepID=A0A1T5FCC6_9SPHI|nr:ABC transporter ATP-binding protein [Daejeonella lutea]SKB93736.1 ABC-type bacteriocin/lantibiotic exporter, contains an N-terminal double-glycine peptidase domain [Daejeonella lutea]
MNTFKKIFLLLDKKQKQQSYVLLFLLIIGMVLEMVGLGILVPVITAFTDIERFTRYPQAQQIISLFGSPSNTEIVIGMMIALTLVYIIKACFLMFLAWKQASFGQNLSKNLSRKLFKKYLFQPYAFHLNRNSAELMRNVVGEVSMLSGVTSSILFLTTNISLMLSIAVMLVYLEPFGAICSVGILATMSWIFYRLSRKKISEWGLSRQFHDGFRQKNLVEGLGGVKDVKVLGRESFFVNNFSRHNDSSYNVGIRMQFLNQAPRIWLELMAVFGLAFVVIGVVVQGKPLGSLVPTIGVFVASAFRLIPSITVLLTSFQTLRFSKPVVDLIYDEFQNVSDLDPEKKITDLKAVKEIKIEDLTFGYEGAPRNAVEKINLTINKGESVGFIGNSGAGKSTMVDLILGLLRPSSGQVTVDGKNINHDLRAWQDQIGYVPQSIFLTDDTLRKNVAFGVMDEDIDDEAVKRAIKAAQLEEYVDGLELGLNSMVGERGVRISGGQRQRIGIARALYHDPQILILDEATSSLDTATESEVMNAVNLLHGNKTIIIVAHRLSTLSKCDVIFQLNKGRIQRQGTAEEMLS